MCEHGVTNLERVTQPFFTSDQTTEPLGDVSLETKKRKFSTYPQFSITKPVSSRLEWASSSKLSTIVAAAIVCSVELVAGAASIVDCVFESAAPSVSSKPSSIVAAAIVCSEELVAGAASIVDRFYNSTASSSSSIPPPIVAAAIVCSVELVAGAASIVDRISDFCRLLNWIVVVIKTVVDSSQPLSYVPRNSSLLRLVDR
ncbi:hypothetical protein CC80DRAFT_504425 [Byssothecium circinans]|uniref:Uncharacterized protein n=1 Tax=Byssothecium circinans TaxID=147558 RepID=A0A6A5U0S1_9PLEO|nr:hypothetical protein CC80DRAFT_504425 [Byssothecium circinans]